MPVVTLAGEGMHARVGASVAIAAGHAETIARTPADYAALVRRLLLARARGHGGGATLAAADGHTAMREWRQRFGAQRDAPLFDLRRWVRDFERLVRVVIDAAAHAPPGVTAHIALSAQTRTG